MSSSWRPLAATHCWRRSLKLCTARSHISRDIALTSSIIYTKLIGLLMEYAFLFCKTRWKVLERGQFSVYIVLFLLLSYFFLISSSLLISRVSALSTAVLTFLLRPVSNFLHVYHLLVFIPCATEYPLNIFCW
jgi:hypothetical protein